MTMYLNYAVMGATCLRSDGLGPVDSVAHPLKAGAYQGTVWLNDRLKGTFLIHIEAEGDGDQVDIDLASIGKRGKVDPLDRQPQFSAGCLKDNPVFAVFHSDGESSGYRVSLTRKGEEENEFDSSELSRGDYYILTPLKPGSWKIKTSSGTEGSLSVEEAKPTGKPMISQNGATIQTDGKVLKPAKAKIVSGDGVVFEITGGKVTIEVALKPTRRPPGRIHPDIRFPGRIKTT